jgi:hypothetical protein
VLTQGTWPSLVTGGGAPPPARDGAGASSSGAGAGTGAGAGGAGNSNANNNGGAAGGSAEYAGCSLPAELEECCEQFRQFYLGKHSGRNLRWQTHMGEADMKVRHKRIPRVLLCI